MRAVTPGVLVALAALLTSPEALAGSRVDMELEPKVGYAGEYTTGLSPYGAFVGLGLRACPVAHLWLAASLASYAGSSTAADGPGVSFRARDRAYVVTLDARWRFARAGLFAEPGLELGASWIFGSTYVTPLRVADQRVDPTAGLVVAFGVKLSDRAAVGVDGAALYLPSDPAAPIARGAAFARVAF